MLCSIQDEPRDLIDAKEGVTLSDNVAFDFQRWTHKAWSWLQCRSAKQADNSLLPLQSHLKMFAFHTSPEREITKELQQLLDQLIAVF